MRFRVEIEKGDGRILPWRWAVWMTPTVPPAAASVYVGHGYGRTEARARRQATRAARRFEKDPDRRRRIIFEIGGGR